MKPFRRLIYFTNGSIGDFLMVLYFADLARSADPKIEVHIVAPRNKSLFQELAAAYPFRIHECNQRSVRGILSCMGLGALMFSLNLVILPSTPGKTPISIKLMGRFLSLRRRSLFVGFKDGSASWRYFDRTFDFDAAILYSESMAKLARDLGFQIAARLPQISLKKDHAILASLDLIPGKYIVLHPCGSSAVRSLSREDIGAVMDAILSRDPQMNIVITGSEIDKRYLGDSFKGAANVSIAAGSVPMSQLAAIIAECKLYIGVDTGITHLASFLGARSLVISHEASVYYWLPYYNPSARILYSIHGCMHGMHEGLEHLKSCYDETDRYLIGVPRGVILKALSDISL